MKVVNIKFKKIYFLKGSMPTPAQARVVASFLGTQ